MASLSLKDICKVYPNGFQAVKNFKVWKTFPPVSSKLMASS